MAVQTASAGRSDNNIGPGRDFRTANLTRRVYNLYMLERQVSDKLLHLIGHFPCLLLFGARQCGKTTLVSRTAVSAGRKYLTFDDLEVLAAARSDPDAFLDQAERITIDGVQRFPEIFVRVKRAVDRERKPGRFLLTGPPLPRSWPPAGPLLWPAAALFLSWDRCPSPRPSSGNRWIGTPC